MEHSSIALSHPGKTIKGTVQLTGSKSESNRALIIQALSKGNVHIENLSNADDTVIMQRALKIAAEPQPETQTINIGPAGTAMRFLTSYLNLVKGNFILTGTERMQQRPIGILVDALKTLGADIHYEKKAGYPPLKIEGGMFQNKNEVSIKGNISSQYISSLLLIAAALKKGLTLHIEGELTSRPYVSMTLDMLKEAGISHTWSENAIEIAPQETKEATLYIEPDWSAASYWYAIVALSEDGHIVLPGLKQNSLQGDSAIVDIMTHFGVRSSFEQDGLHLHKSAVDSDQTLFDFKECPDLAQTVIVCAAALKRDISFTGLETLKIKETDRIAALQNEIGKFGALLLEDNGIYHLKTSNVFKPEHITIRTYEDHRMAMAFAPLALVFDQIHIEDHMVVEKSYPEFWDHLKNQNFTITA
ncbi:3-phosphoshikimate 1-carboxyvinyltransferase [Sphingobacterium spiritivorum]|uniref:3-phosphoshikimate 1-carboxyvinyltransferase n=1 Tax=Sphingobacterium spiritivorum ATCC 33861 TaxID=525373 RepID=D7VPB6_SPHSI|nr:3-phosphoshikimate 1-carboxyvinyltransferase [Sphingobacterium spiritivorum]EFK57763.1 putative 3-phosphoshikimate 1-carboxyvinyltransferase [Sphingobacterium spiritivorum ATCC 33861]QQT36207.1 3-phosphoshikimate 1-carboxyvinyltransferase [Sphingobacterium spiritivorum]WQD32944.1 3-phosphoshikimate 1-carboxyvinyltransferase [Sphingobacterium spiritivorum]SUJ16905.1 3-phosphoshikimate 1-carboxyvinyltransferase [Sphingobacterium spiritivorum]